MEIEASRSRFQSALLMATQLHDGQFRKGTSIPYVSHLMAVASLVLEAGGDEDEAIAALLHDGPEDQGGLETLERIRNEFGGRVADIVAECSDTFEEPKPPWKERKISYLEHLASVSASTLLVSCADKLHNARAILTDYRVVGEDLWDRFRGGRDGTLWYYRTLVNRYQELRSPRILVDELGRVVAQLERMAGERVDEKRSMEDSSAMKGQESGIEPSRTVDGLAGLDPEKFETDCRPDRRETGIPTPDYIKELIEKKNA